MKSLYYMITSHKKLEYDDVHEIAKSYGPGVLLWVDFDDLRIYTDRLSIGIL